MGDDNCRLPLLYPLQARSLINLREIGNICPGPTGLLHMANIWAIQANDWWCLKTPIFVRVPQGGVSLVILREVKRSMHLIFFTLERKRVLHIVRGSPGARRRVLEDKIAIPCVSHPFHYLGSPVAAFKAATSVAVSVLFRVSTTRRCVLFCAPPPTSSCRRTFS